MAAPRKNGLDYFPFDVGFFSDRKIQHILTKFGCDGVCVLIYLYTQIYHEGYFITYDEDLISDTAYALNISENFARQVLDYLLGRSMLSVREMHDDTLAGSVKVITAKSIQRRYQEAKKGAKRDVFVRAGCWLLKKEETLDFIKMHPDDDNSRNNGSFSVNNPSNSGIYSTKKSKVNQSKENESKAEEKAAAPPALYNLSSLTDIVDLFHEICISYPKVDMNAMKKKNIDSINGILQEHNMDEIRECFRLAEQSDFLKFRKKPLPADFDWIMEKHNFNKILNGNYNDGGKKNGNNPNNNEQSDTEAWDSFGVRL